MTERASLRHVIEQRYKYPAYPWHSRRQDLATRFRFRCVYELRDSLKPLPGPTGLAWTCSSSDDEGVSVVLVLVVFGAAIWWQARRKKWGAVRTLVFWLVVLAVVWVLASRYNAAHPQG